MGGLRIRPDASQEELVPSEVGMFILPGGDAWEHEGISGLDDLVLNLYREKKTIGAICAATTFLGKLGLLDNIEHTSNGLDYLKKMAPGYQGATHYSRNPAVRAGNVITASGIGAIEFAREIFSVVGLFSEDDIEKWFQLFKYGVWVD